MVAIETSHSFFEVVFYSINANTSCSFMKKLNLERLNVRLGLFELYFPEFRQARPDLFRISQAVPGERLENILQLTPTVRSAFLSSVFSRFCIC